MLTPRFSRILGSYPADNLASGYVKNMKSTSKIWKINWSLIFTLIEKGQARPQQKNRCVSFLLDPFDAKIMIGQDLPSQTNQTCAFTFISRFCWKNNIMYWFWLAVWLRGTFWALASSRSSSIKICVFLVRIAFTLCILHKQQHIIHITTFIWLEWNRRGSAGVFQILLSKKKASGERWKKKRETIKEEHGEEKKKKKTGVLFHIGTHVVYKSTLIL